MSQALVETNSTDIIVSQNISINKTPKEILQDAHLAARELQAVISKKKKPVKFNGEQYLEFEDWQTLGRFYGLTVKIDSTKFVEFGDVKGFEAIASVINVNTGIEVSSAESLCLNDERNWSNKPLFQLKSMAQTRAGSKALRNVLAWVVVMAGYKPTPAEEMAQSDRVAPNTDGLGDSPSYVPQVSVVSKVETKEKKGIDFVGMAKDLLGAKVQENYNLGERPHHELDLTNPAILQTDQPPPTFGEEIKKQKMEPWYELINGQLIVHNSLSIKDKLKRNGFIWHGDTKTWNKTYSAFDEEALKEMINGK